MEKNRKHELNAIQEQKGPKSAATPPVFNGAVAAGLIMLPAALEWIGRLNAQIGY